MTSISGLSGSQFSQNTTRNRHACTGIILILIVSLFAGTATAQENNEWPIFHGSDRSNKSTETGLLKVWPEKGPGMVWSVSGLGDGYSTVSIAKGHVYTSGKIGDQTYVFAYDLDGKLLWKAPNGKPWSTEKSFKKSHIGARGTPTYNDGVVYYLDEVVQLSAFDYKTGKQKWSLDLREAFDAIEPDWGYSASVLIDGNRLYCSTGGTKGFIVCLDKKDGSLIWSCNDVTGEAGHGTPKLIQYGGYRQLMNMTSNCVYGLDSATGKLLWKVDFENRVSINITEPIFHDGYVFVSSGYGIGCKLIKLVKSGADITTETVWKSELMDNHHGGVILHEGYLYGSGDKSRGWFCLDFMTGKQLWMERGKGSILFADNMFYCLEEKGTMRLIRATPEKFEEISSFEVPEGGKTMHWAHPVILDGRMYIRHGEKLFVYDVKG
ncbi:PQQ-binding-like beta-propeller repeat protein [Candidatus Latescibacterota bacterium]